MQEAKYADETQKIVVLCDKFVEVVHSFALSMIHAMAELKQRKAAAKEAAQLQQQAIQQTSQAMIAFRTPPQASYSSYSQWKHPTANHSEIIPGRFKANGQPMTKSEQVCKKFLSGSCTYGAKCIFDHPASMAPASGPSSAADMTMDTKPAK